MTETQQQKFIRRDQLIALEAAARAKWEHARAFEEDAVDDGREKYMITFPFPYMNGVLHLGHAFSLSKAEFAAGYQRLKGKRVLFPFAFHCTGMPIAACAKKLSRELEQFGNPPIFPTAVEEADASESANGNATIKKKGKVAKKASACVYQWQIIAEIGVPEHMIASFADPLTWLSYFPPIAIDHLKHFGLKTDWRRSFITTDVNPYFDAFVKWQFRKLYAAGHIKFGSRLSIYSPLDRQPCADHDRASGEGVGPQEYVAVKLELVSAAPPALAAVLPDAAKVFLLCATLRPETVYGQTNAWVLPHGDYACIRGPNNEVWICSERSAQNMAYQFLLPGEFGEVDFLCTLKGWDLLGAAVCPPLAEHRVVYMLPLLTISMSKGTGLVMSVPSDSPDDYIALQDLIKDSAMRDKYHVTEEMCSLQAPAIIRTPEFGDRAAPFVCAEMKIKNQHDAKKLADAKERVYKQGFYEGTLLLGSCAGMKVAEAKPIVRKQMVEAGQALIYSEPEREVIARSGCSCVVAQTDQWFLEYGEAAWAAKVANHVQSRLECYNPIAKEMFVNVVDWLRGWACSRSFGLGTKLPFGDDDIVIESLSDSTIYMAYYTIAHFLQKGDLRGEGGPIPADAITDADFDYVFGDTPMPDESAFEPALLMRMRNEFRYFYGVDLRVSGKDLIGNHLVMALYNHAAIWPDDPQYWPKSYFTNGHALLNNEKMSKSTGNFLTLVQACKDYGVDALRFALADAGDGLEDANVSLTVTANAAILRLTKELEWIVATVERLRTSAPATPSFADKLFENRLNACIVEADEAFANMQFRAALKAGVYNLQAARDQYRTQVGEDHMSPDLIRRYLDVFTILLSPICPFTAEHIWGDILGRAGLVVDAAWPSAGAVDSALTAIGDYLDEVAHKIRIKLAQPKKGGGSGTTLTLAFAKEYPVWQQTVFKIIGDIDDDLIRTDRGKACRDATVAIRTQFGSVPDLKARASQAQKFAAAVIQQVAERGKKEALRVAMPFDEGRVLKENLAFLMRGTGLVTVDVVADETGTCSPGVPSIRIG